jgi:hypothetical protein
MALSYSHVNHAICCWLLSTSKGCKLATIFETVLGTRRGMVFSRTQTPLLAHVMLTPLNVVVCNKYYCIDTMLQRTYCMIFSLRNRLSYYVMLNPLNIVVCKCSCIDRIILCEKKWKPSAAWLSLTYKNACYMWYIDSFFIIKERKYCGNEGMTRNSVWCGLVFSHGRRHPSPLILVECKCWQLFLRKQEIVGAWSCVVSRRKPPSHALSIPLNMIGCKYCCSNRGCCGLVFSRQLPAHMLLTPLNIKGCKYCRIDRMIRTATVFSCCCSPFPSTQKVSSVAFTRWRQTAKDVVV